MEKRTDCLRQEEVRVKQFRSGRVAHKSQKEPEPVSPSYSLGNDGCISSPRKKRKQLKRPCQLTFDCVPLARRSHMATLLHKCLGKWIIALALKDFQKKGS